MATTVVRAAFVPYFNQIIIIMETNENMRRTGIGILKQVAWMAGGTVIGGCLAGPTGALAGAITGAVIGYAVGDEYQSMIENLKGMTNEEKRKLVRQIQKSVGSATTEALTRFVAAHENTFVTILKTAIEKVRDGRSSK